MQATVNQGNSGLFILEGVAAPVETGLADIDAGLYYLDQDTGIIYERQPSDGDAAADGTWLASGKLLPFVGDQTAPATPTGLAVNPVTVQQADGTTVPGFEVSWNANTEDDLLGYTIQADTNPASWANPMQRNVGKTTTVLMSENFIAGTAYDFRIYARDAEGFTSVASSTVTGTASPDGTAPEVPTGLDVFAGYKMLGLTWDRNIEADLAFYQVRVHPTSDSTDTTVFQTRTSRLVVTGLAAGVSYDVEVRAIDRSGNVATSAADLTGLNFDENPDSGYSATIAGTPTLVGNADIVAGTVVTDFLSTGSLSADQIEGGTLSVGYAGQTGNIEVFNSTGQSIAVISSDGMVMVNPNNTQEAMWLKAGSLKFTDAYDGNVATTVWTAGITPEGINASAITFGSVLGGANSVPNAGFELASFAVITTKVWTVTADWATATSQVNLATGGSSLTMTAV